MRQKLNIITLGVQSMEASLYFYEKVLGWKKSSSSNDNISFFPLGGIVLALYGKAKLAEDARVPNNSSGFAGFTLAYNTKSEEEVDAVLKLIKSGGGKIVKPAEKVFWGGYSGYVADPDGYLIEVAYNPFWEMDVNDNLILPM
jgi:uncharacterized protein